MKTPVRGFVQKPAGAERGPEAYLDALDRCDIFGVFYTDAQANPLCAPGRRDKILKRSLRWALSSLLVLGSNPAHAADLPTFDASAAAPTIAANAPLAGEMGFVSAFDRQRDAPSFFFASDDFPAADRAASPEEAARFYLSMVLPLYGLDEASLRTATVRHVHDTGRGAIVVSFRQRADGIDLVRHDVKVLLSRSRRLVAIAGSLHRALSPSFVPSFSLPPEAALARAFEDLYGIREKPTSFVDTGRRHAGFSLFELGFAPTISAAGFSFTRPARVRRVLFPLQKAIVPAYGLELFAGPKYQTGSDAYSYVIAADDGRLLYRENLTSSATYTYRAWSDGAPTYSPPSGPQADYLPHPAGFPDGSTSPFVLPTTINVDGLNKNPGGGFDPWLAAGSLETKGNNVDAYADHYAPDGFSSGDVRASTTAPGVFDRTYDTAQSALANPAQIMASVTQLFYVTNWLHDFYYDSGFDEAAGNAQTNNFGRGGASGDALKAEAQDGAPAPTSNRNNANMTVPADGGAPRMQMYVWDGKDSQNLTISPAALSPLTSLSPFGTQYYNVSAQVVLATDTTAPVNDGCTAFTNSVTNKIALVDRGGCTFVLKAQNAQAAGAVGLVIANNATGLPAITGTAAGVTIPVMGISQADGVLLKNALVMGAQTGAMQHQAGVLRDGTIDNGIVAHEWGHFIHHRLVDCGSQQCRAQSEGMGDVIALQTLVRGDDNPQGAFAIGMYATVSIGDSAYFGVRRYPYSKDFNINALTFQHIQNGVALPVLYMQTTSDVNAEVHNAGEIWAAMLFEAYTNLLGATKGTNPRYTFAEARRLFADDLVTGMQMAPPEPTYTEQRDALLAAALAREPLDFALYAQAFATRGAGACAVSPDRWSTSLVGVVESFEQIQSLAVLSVDIDDNVLSCDNDGVLDGNELGRVHVNVKNVGWAPLAGATLSVSSTSPGVVFPNGTTVALPTIAPLGTTIANIDITLDPAISGVRDLALHVVANAPGACLPTSTDDSAHHIDYDNLAASATIDDFESTLPTWKSINPQGPSDAWSRIRMTSGSANHLYHGASGNGGNDDRLESPPMLVGTTGLVLSFDHRYAFEQDANTNGDGGVVEISQDNGATWVDVASYGSPGYSGKVGPVVTANPLLGRNAYIGTSAGFPLMQNVTVNMGNTLAGKTIKVRFRIGTDIAGSAAGWDIDNVALQGIVGKPFPSLVADLHETCQPQTGAGGAGGMMGASSSVSVSASASTGMGGMSGASSSVSVGVGGMGGAGGGNGGAGVGGGGGGGGGGSGGSGGGSDGAGGIGGSGGSVSGSGIGGSGGSVSGSGSGGSGGGGSSGSETTGAGSTSGGTNGTGQSGGCDCGVSSDEGPRGGLFLLGLLGAALVRRRQREAQARADELV